MDIFLDLNSEVPIYQQIRNEVIVGVAEGRLQSGDTLPSTRQLAADFGINFHTVNKAYDMLRQEGVIRLNRKTGAVVFVEPASSKYREEWQNRAKIWLAEALVKGMEPREIIRQCESIVLAFKLANPSNGDGLDG